MLLMRITKARLRFECDNKCKIVLRFTQLVRIIILLTLGMYQVEVQAAKIATNKKKIPIKIITPKNNHKNRETILLAINKHNNGDKWSICGYRNIHKCSLLTFICNTQQVSGTVKNQLGWAFGLLCEKPFKPFRDVSDRPDQANCN